MKTHPEHAVTFSHDPPHKPIDIIFVIHYDDGMLSAYFGQIFPVFDDELAIRSWPPFRQDSQLCTAWKRNMTNLNLSPIDVEGSMGKKEKQGSEFRGREKVKKVILCTMSLVFEHLSYPILSRCNMRCHMHTYDSNETTRGKCWFDGR